MTDNVYSVYSGQKIDINITWEAINKKMEEDLNYLFQQKLNASFILLGKVEYRLVVEHFSAQSKRYFAPSSINGIPIVLVPVTNSCTVVPNPHDLEKLLV